MFKVGDKVISSEFGRGIVVRINNDNTYPILVDFKDGSLKSFIKSGHYDSVKSHDKRIFLIEDKKPNDLNGDDSSRPTDFTMGTKYDTDKLDWTLLPFDSLEEVVEVLMMGEKKYARDNWMVVKPKSRYLKAAFRHLIQYASGESVDSESGKSHLAHCICCLLFLIWHDKKGSD